MAETNPQWNDGAIPYGSRSAVFTRGVTGLGTYILENITLTRPSKVLKRYDQIGGPSGSVGVPDFVEGSATAQLAATTTKQLRAGDFFTDTFDTDLGPETFIVNSPEQPETYDGIKKMSIKLIKKMN